MNAARAVANALELRGGDILVISIMLPWPLRSFVVLPKRHQAELWKHSSGNWRRWHRLRFRSCISTWLFQRDALRRGMCPRSEGNGLCRARVERGEKQCARHSRVGRGGKRMGAGR